MMSDSEKETGLAQDQSAEKNGSNSEENVEEDKKAENLEIIKNYISELITRFEQKHEERIKNNVGSIVYPDENFFSKLDASIKKNSTFVKKLKNISDSQKENIMKDLNVLNLSRYISEVAQALVETKIKVNEIPLFINICSFLHVRYQDFSPQFRESWIKSLPRKPSDSFNSSKMRIDIRVFAELILSGIFPTKDSLPILGNLLTALISNDKENHKNLNIIISFCRQYTNEFSGLVPRKMKELAQQFDLEIPKCDFLPVDKQKGVQALLKDYYQSLVTHLLRDHKIILNMEKDIKRILDTRGEVSQSLKEKYEAKQLDFQKLWTSATQFADLIDEEMPQLDSNLIADDQNKSVVLDFNNKFCGEGSPNANSFWDDDETRTFYENLPDLKLLIPAILYKDSLKDAIPESKENCEQVNGGENNVTLNKETEMNDEFQVSIDDIEKKFAISEKDVPILNENDEVEEEKDDKKNKLKTTNFIMTKNQLDLFFSSLPNCVNRDLIDKAALTFSTTLNTRNNRKNLVRALFTVHRTRLDLLPFYGRFVAQLSSIMPSVASDLVAALKNQFRYNFVKKDQVNIESKVKIVRFIGELVKFNIFPKSDVFYIFKTLLSDFHHHHIEMTCNLFETCGQFLFRCPDSYHLTKHLLEQMMRLKQRMHLDARYEIMIENAYCIVNPPDEKLQSRHAENKPPIHLYIEHCIFNELNKKSISKVLNKLRKIDWQSKETSDFAINCLSSAWNLKFYHISALVHLLAALYQNQSWVVLRVLDNVFEDIRLGMEMNSIEHNQRRIAMIKYFSECYNYNLIDSTLLFSVLYSLMTYGINYEDITKSNLDPPFNLMRFRLVAQVLHTCGSYLQTSLARKKLDYFLLFFQRYYWLKKSYLDSLSPQDQITLNAQTQMNTIFKEVILFVKPRFRIADSYEAACKQLETRVKELTNSLKEVLPKVSISTCLNPNAVSSTSNGLEPIEETLEDEDQEGDKDSETASIFNDLQEGESLSETDEESDLSEPDEMLNVEDEEEDFNQDTNNEKLFETKVQVPLTVKCEEDDEFQKNYEKLLNENLISRSQEVFRSNTEIAIPIERDSDKKIKTNASSFQQSQNNQLSFSNNISFRIMTRNVRSNKPVLKPIEIPTESEFVQNYLTREEILRAEREKVKKLTLNINERFTLEDNIQGPRNEQTNSTTFKGNNFRNDYRKY